MVLVKVEFQTLIGDVIGGAAPLKRLVRTLVQTIIHVHLYVCVIIFMYTLHM